MKASSRQASPGQYLVQAFANMIENPKAKVTFRWISSHGEVKGNETADELAKEAASGRASTRDKPQRKLPTSASAAGQEHLEELKRHWHSLRQDSPRRRRFELIDDNFPFTSFRRRKDKLSRRQANLLIQVRSGHNPFYSK